MARRITILVTLVAVVGVRGADLPKTAAVAADDPTVIARIGDPRFRHCGEVQQVAMHPDGKRFASTAAGENGARFWDIATGKQLRRFQHPDFDPPAPGQKVFGSDFRYPDYGQHLRFSADGKRVVVVSATGKLVCFDTDTGKPTCAFPVKRHWWCPAFSPDGSRLAAFDPASALTMWEVASGKAVFTGPACKDDNDGDTGTLIAFSPDGKRLAACLKKDSVWVAPVNDPDAAREFQVYIYQDGKRACDPVWPDDRRLIVSNGTHYREIDLKTGKESMDTSGLGKNSGEPVSAYKFVRENGSRPRVVRLVKAGENNPVDDWTGDPTRVLFREHGRLRVLGDGKYLATEDHIWDVSGGTPVRPDRRPDDRKSYYSGNAFNCADNDRLKAISPDDKWVVAGGHQRLAIRSTADGAEWRVLDDYRGRPKPRYFGGCGNDPGPAWCPDLFLFHPDGRLFGFRFGLRDNEPKTTLTLRTLDHPGGPKEPIPDPFRLGADGSAVSVHLSRDGRRMLVVVAHPSRERWHLRVYETATLAEIYRVTPANGVCVAEFAPDGRRLYVGHNDTTYSIYSADRLDEKHLSRGDPSRWADADPKVGLAAARAVAADPNAVGVVRAACAEPKVDVPRLVGQLGDAEYKTREAATKTLAVLGRAVEPALREAAANPASPEAGERLERLLHGLTTGDGRLSAEDRKVVRAVEVLERVGTPAASEVLTGWAKGGSPVRKAEAAAALARLNRK